MILTVCRHAVMPSRSNRATTPALGPGTTLDFVTHRTSKLARLRRPLLSRIAYQRDRAGAHSRW